MTDKARSRLGWIRIGLWVAVAVISVVFLATRFIDTSDPTAAQVAPDYGGPFTLTAHTGKAVSDTDFRGKVLLIYFGFTYCPDVCPTSLQTIGAAMDRLPSDVRAQVQPLFVSVDPERDTPEVLAPYVTHFVPEMIGLTGAPDDVQKVADSFRIAYWKVKDPDSALPYTVDHASVIFLMDRNGRYITHFASKPGSGSALTPDQLAEAVLSAVRTK